MSEINKVVALKNKKILSITIDGVCYINIDYDFSEKPIEINTLKDLLEANNISQLCKM